MNKFEQIKAFGMTNQMLAEDLVHIGSKYNVELGHLPAASQGSDDVYYPQIEATIRAEASQMAKHYEVFYSLEKSIRALVAATMKQANGESWWDTGNIPVAVKQEVKLRIKKEKNAGVTKRSDEELDYTTFGELADIINANWNIFGSPFNSQPGFQKVMTNLNALRNPIAHCCPLAEDEVVRLRLTVKDWFRLME